MVLAHPKMNPTWAPPRPSQDVNETGSMIFCQFEQKDKKLTRSLSSDAAADQRSAMAMRGR